MRLIVQNLVAAFWAFILGEILGYIGSQLDLLTIQPLEMGIIAIVVALAGVNSFYYITRSAELKED
ncbi:hypothetical protein FC26_GL002074 [Paucilactobacillus vaccinostercus DSM 20634]|jgi:hypothetical protein|uniref:DUF2929 domain-containing protein n=1 Tax=Paucilactobacillus vaccinostercus DSM 20634 TaxID=1423813 RepID=A0A0R2AA33_9LACO|nr:DUF2929 family protein [Paucilactobacillus vaccinostercus]KRM62500.1 hypothetical protein FC26_GL002074 [Paucilactobacillus vaccinostercus DSM 20634]RRG09672.1 MAG: DUF2929 family protein [Lactobacillus sp.]